MQEAEVIECGVVSAILGPIQQAEDSVRERHWLLITRF